MEPIRLATRGSQLATTQTRLVGALLEEATGRTFELVEVTTTGDVDQNTSVAQLTEIGAFVRAVQQAVLAGRADAAVHSCKDLPTANPNGFATVYPKRAAPWDVLVGAALSDLPERARVGTGSPRRAAQLRRLRPDLVVADIRGNVDTRIAKVETGEYQAVVLAEAGLARIDRRSAISHRFTLSEMVPAPGQGALAVEFMPDSPHADLLHRLEDAPTARTVKAERSLLAETGAGCRSALGALAHIEGDALAMTAFVEDEQGPRRADTVGPSGPETVVAVRRQLGI